MILEKLRNLPLHTRKIILWSVIAILGLGLLVWWLKIAQERLEAFQAQEFIKELNLPKIEIPQTEEAKEQLQQLKKVIKEVKGREER